MNQLNPISEININIYNDFMNRFKIMMDSNNFSSMDVVRALMIFSKVEPVDKFIDSKNVSLEDTQNLDKMTELFNDYLISIEFTKPFGFNIEDDNFDYRDGFIEAGINSHHDLNKTTLSNLCEYIYYSSEDRHICASSIFAVAKAYLQTIDKLPENDQLSLMELNYCDERGGIISDRLTMKDLINHVEGKGWIRRYLGK